MQHLTKYEIEVIYLLLKDKYNQEFIETLISKSEIINYFHTGAGYFLDLICKDLTLQKETIHTPFVIGKIKEIQVGFLLFVEKNKITIECHGLGDKNPPENIRELNLIISKA